MDQIDIVFKNGDVSWVQEIKEFEEVVYALPWVFVGRCERNKGVISISNGFVFVALLKYEKKEKK